ncbi:MAG: gamma-glutamyltransferase [Hyphomicrobium sp.]|nr:gamma-glutamyltransferase [Hyphomicrobium sp.]
MFRRATLFVALCLASSVTAGAQDTALQPEAGTGATSKDAVTSQKYMIVAANPLAAEAGLEMLRRGGSAVDAAIASQLILGLVEPQSSGLGGGAFIIHWDAKSRALSTIDGRETAPSSATPDRFIRGGRPMPFMDAVRSGLSVGIPGVVRAMELAHQGHGRLAWGDLFAPAIKLAESGFRVPRRLALLLRWQGLDHFSAQARAYFYDAADHPHAEGVLLKNPQYAATLRAIAKGGAAAFYQGAIADAIVAAVAAAPRADGGMTTTDLASYRAETREPLCFAYRTHRICGMGPPSSGALTIAQTLKLIEPLDHVHGAQSRMSGTALHIMAEAQKLAFADRNRYIADPAFVPLPSGYLDDRYLASRRSLIDAQHAMPKPEAGFPPGVAQRSFGVDATLESAGTSHISVVDGDGNAVAMTTTIENAFGSGLWAAGFLLNNQLTDFSFAPTDGNGVAIANAVAAGKRPRSSMAPTMVFDGSGYLEIVTGSPGGSRIILFVTKMLVALLDWDMSAQHAADLPNFGSEGGPVTLEYGGETVWPALVLKGYGHIVKTDMMTSGTHTIVRRGGRLEAGVDPRREGVALGD